LQSPKQEIGDKQKSQLWHNDGVSLPCRLMRPLTLSGFGKMYIRMPLLKWMLPEALHGASLWKYSRLKLAVQR
jgi:hypothetical protein